MSKTACLALVLIGSLARAEPPVSTAEATDAPLEDKGGRVRWGISFNGGLSAPYGGAVFEAELRLGGQVSRRLSGFGTVDLSIGFNQGVHGRLGAIVEWMPVDFFYLGGGAVLAYGSLYSFDGVASLQSQGFKPGLDLRLGLATEPSRPPSFRRVGFTLGIHATLLVHPDTHRTQYTGVPVPGSSDPAVTFTPMLVVGFDSR